MLRLFAVDLTGARLFPPGESPMWTRESFYGEGVMDDVLRHLEFVTNRYHLNPRPRLILFVEGRGEAEQFPRIIEKLLGHRLGPLGIEVRDLQGVGAFTGRASTDRHGALEKLIDDYHFRQTIVFVVLDREGRVPEVRDRLLAAHSRLFPQRALTRAEYVHLWDRCVEFDNFTPAEIADALTTTADGRHPFSVEEVEPCIAAYDTGRGNPLGILYREKLHYDLPKPALLAHLVSTLLSKPEAEFDERRRGRRPLVRLLQRVVRAAVENPQPIREESWLANQESGFLGENRKEPSGISARKAKDAEATDVRRERGPAEPRRPAEEP